MKTLVRTRKFGSAFWAYMSNIHYRNIMFEKPVSVF